MVWNRKPRLRLLWTGILTSAWLISGCQNNPPVDPSATPSADRPAGPAAAPGQNRIDAPNELRLGGERGAPIKIEVFSDFQCPRCRDFYLDALKPLLAEYTRTGKINKIYLVYHDFPLDMHPFARKAARLALAAARLSRERWLRVIDILYVEQEQWSQDGNIEAVLAKAMDPIEVMRIGNLAADPALEAALRDEILLGQSREISSTPTFFVIPQTGPEQRVAGWVTYATLKDFLDRLLH
jgi:protein-disulfide isomerase